MSVHPVQKVYLADGYDLIRSYTEGMQIEETKREQTKRSTGSLCTTGYVQSGADRGTGLCNGLGYIS